MEISDCAAPASIDHDILNIEPVSQPPPKGLPSVPDSIQLKTPAPKPHFLWRAGISFLLVSFHLVMWTIHLCNWTFQSIFGNRQKELYSGLHEIAETKNESSIRSYLKEHMKESYPAAYLFSEFIDIPELYDHFPEMLKGANICMEGDFGLFCRRWSEHPDSYKRLSSHKYKNDECYAIGHVLFWVDPDGNTRLQFENSPWSGLFSSINHIVDFLRYRRDNEQQGITGASPYTEDYCIRVPINLNEFIARKNG